ncbi:MAG: hypothetical protein HFE86_08465 [Clostridiales bacterium]|nr:hypothetical protein [Clostridiales bacterium]
MQAAKRLKILAIAAGSACLLSAVLLTIAFWGGQPAAAASHPSSEESELRPLYTVGSYNNRVAVFVYGETEPSQVLEEVFLRSLPAGDRQRLEQGIPVYSEEDLWSLLEDLES